MAVRWTQRPQNFCRQCGNSWYPRGKNRSSNCSRCGSPEVELALEGCLRAIGYLIFGPFILVGLLLQAVVTVVVYLVGGLLSVAWSVIRLVAKLLGFTVAAGSTAGGVAVGWSARNASPAASWLAERSRPLLAWAGAQLREAGKHALAAVMFVGRWVASAKDDVLSEGDREVNPLSLLAKLVTFVSVGIVISVLAIKLVRGVFSLWS